AQEYGQQELYQSLQAFNTLLRASISGSREMIPLREELALVESFENIQRLRYGESFIVSGSIEESYMNIAVPKLILQPVVENAIFYGEETDGVTRISITVAVVHGEFIIKVTDNGPGMDIKLIEDVQKDNRRKFNRIGLKNVDERVKILFGDEYGLSIESAPGKGTTVTISMPGALC
ncbi:MAG: histidine kinase, partial [Spirochaetales bacterium]|nr:histidine kinase [Spirochaetales bacterium]